MKKKKMRENVALLLGVKKEKGMFNVKCVNKSVFPKLSEPRNIIYIRKSRGTPKKNTEIIVLL